MRLVGQIKLQSVIHLTNKARLLYNHAGLLKQFGPERVWDTPISEMGKYLLN
mgnify:CR=1 FL=1